MNGFDDDELEQLNDFFQNKRKIFGSNPAFCEVKCKVFHTETASLCVFPERGSTDRK